MIDSTSNFVEHPELVADRIVQYADAVGRENVIAGVDCGFGTFAGRVQVDTKIVWMKLASLAEGARLARSSCGISSEAGIQGQLRSRFAGLPRRWSRYCKDVV